MDMITSNVTTRVFFIKSEFGTGTAFTVEFKEKQYLTTARHLFRADSSSDPYSKIVNHGDKVEIEIFHNGNWIRLDSQVYFHKFIDIDIAILTLPRDISLRHDLPLDSQGIVFGGDAYFLGFPYQLFSGGSEINNNFPFPFIKKCVLSAYNKGSNNEVLFYFDGHNNPGFSGGPIVFKDVATNLYKICAIVKGYLPQQGVIDLKTLVINYTENSGIIVGYNSRHATEILEAL